MKTPIVLFPGQGSQCKDMGRALALADTDSMDLWKKAERLSGLSLREIFWDGDEADMSATNALQPALLVVHCSLWMQFASRLTPMGAAGHSLGEFAALACAHVLDIDDALAITCLRGALMHEAGRDTTGAMAAVLKLESATVEQLVAQASAETGELLVCANYNTPVQTVVSGTEQALACVQAKIKAKKGRVVPLKVRGAFHSPLMEEANREFIPALTKVDWHTARFPITTNVDGLAETDGERLKEKMCRQMVSSVRWVETIRSQYAAGARAWLELGPRAVLTKMVGACVPEGAEEITSEHVRTEEEFSAWLA